MMNDRTNLNIALRYSMIGRAKLDTPVIVSIDKGKELVDFLKEMNSRGYIRINTNRYQINRAN
jgi:hypothetical protein